MKQSYRHCFILLRWCLQNFGLYCVPWHTASIYKDRITWKIDVYRFLVRIAQDVFVDERMVNTWVYKLPKMTNSLADIKSDSAKNGRSNWSQIKPNRIPN